MYFINLTLLTVSDIPNVVVIITDGQSNVNHELTLPEARALKSAGVTIITVAVGFTSETAELVGLTSPPVSENLIYVTDYESLDKLKDQLIDPLCSGKTFHYSNTPMQYTAIFHGCKNFNFQMKKYNIFLIFAQNIDFGYTLEPPH